MLAQLTAVQIRLLGCLMEKAVTTPEQMPLTLNALTNAANQKSARDPVMALDKATVQSTARHMAEDNLLHVDENFRSGVEKYRQRLFGTGEQFGDIKLNKAQFAILTLLLLRGPQTPGEIRSRAGRLHAFADNAAVAEAARALYDPDNAASSLLIELPRLKGRKEAQLMHQLGGVIDPEAYVTAQAGDTRNGRDNARIDRLEARIKELEQENARLRARLGWPVD